MAAPRLTASDKLLASTISLPTDLLISCFVFSPLAGPSTHSRAYNDILELARREVLAQNRNRRDRSEAATTLIGSVLTSVHIRGGDSCMYAFFIGRRGQSHPPTELTALHFDGLAVTSQVSFAPKDIYPSCSSCAEESAPCATCALQHLPDQPLRAVYSHFLEAVRTRLIDDISGASNSSQPARKRLVKRFKGGFILGPPPSSTEWSKGWDTHASSRPLVFCQLQIHLSPAGPSPQPQLIIHPQLHTTPFVVLPHGPGRPLTEGAPITLLPHGTPAFYLASYSGPTSALRRQFHESLKGLGVCGWDAEEGDDHWFTSKNHPERQETTFIIAWISVENKQGEDKGITIIYPSSLCLSFAPCATPTCAAGRREPLAYIPDLPPQLQPSPQVVSALPPASAVAPAQQQSHLDFATIRPASCPTSPSPYAIRAFRALTLSRLRGLRGVASEVNTFVDAVAKDREKERERMRKEREREGGSPRLARMNTSGGVTTVTTPAATPAATAPTPTPTTTASAPPPLPVPQPVQQPHPPIQNQTTVAPSTFYPSPPQADPLFVPPDESRTSPVIPDPPQIPDVAVPDVLAPPNPTNAMAVQAQLMRPTPQTFDPFDQSYMDIDLTMNMNGFGMIDMGMDFGIGPSGSGNEQQRGGATMSMEFDEADITEDDFSFFDRPAVVSSAPLSMSAPADLHLGVGASPSVFGMAGMLGMSPPMFGESPGAAAHALATGDWAGAVFTPGPELHHVMAGIPDIHMQLPLSPEETPGSQHAHAASAPATPNVHLALADGGGPGERASSLLSRRASVGTLGFGIFDPIPFAESHRVADGKYAVGKFALPSPPPEPGDEWGVEGGHPALGSSAPTRLGGAFVLRPGPKDSWRAKYESATDPRIGVVRKLIGVKRKTAAVGMREGGRLGNSRMSPAWMREHEDWESRHACEEEEEEVKTEPESDEDDAEEEESPLESRPSTPPPAYLPLGPTLLHTHFQHAHLLLLSTPLRPPGSAVAPTSMTTFASAAAAVPTPVSPAATLGAASEKSKSLEAAAFAVGREVVENSVWAEAWRTNMMGAGAKQLRDAVWPADVKMVAQLLQRVPGVEGPLDMEALFDLGHSMPSAAATKSVQTLEAPMISIGKADAVVQLLPSALRFWEKIGLTPRGGRKDATVFVLFEDDGDPRQQLVESWLARVTAMYHSKHLGTLTPGNHSMCSRDGVFAMRFDSTFRKTLANFVANFVPSHSNTVFYVFTPLSTMSLASPLLRQIFSAVKKALQAHEDSQSLFQFVPEALIASSVNCNPGLQIADLEAVCYSTYDRILQPVDRVMSRRFFEHGEPIRGYFQDPAYSLARPVHATVKYVQRTKGPLDVVDSGTFLHVGYAFSECGKWILCACVDQRGEAHDLAVWLTQTQSPGADGEDAEVDTFTNEEYAVRKVWDFACRFAKRASIAWRIVFARLGSMGVADLEAWMGFLPKAVQTCSALPDVQVSLLSVETDAPWAFLPPEPQAAPQLGNIKSPPSTVPVPTPASNIQNQKLHPSLPAKPMATRVPSASSISKPPVLYVDVSSTTYAVFPKRYLPLSLPPAPPDLGLVLSYVPESGYSSPTTTVATPGPSEGGIASPLSTSTCSTSAASPGFPHPLPVRPLSTTLLVRVPAASIASTAAMMHVDLLAAFPRDAYADNSDSIQQLHAEITKSYHELSVLASARWRLAQSGGADPILPFHLAAVDAMRTALERDGTST